MDTIETLRKKIEEIDADIIKNLAIRKQLVQSIGKLKAKAKVGITDAQREQQLMMYYQKLSAEHQLEYEMVKNLFSLIISYSRDVQKK